MTECHCILAFSMLATDVRESLLLCSDLKKLCKKRGSTNQSSLDSFSREVSIS